MPQWQRITTPTYIHYLDPALANAWFDQAIAASSRTAETAGNGQTAAQQAALVRQAWLFLGYAYQAMDLNPWGEPLYVQQLQMAYGPGFAPGTQTLTILGNPGTIAAAAISIYQSTHAAGALGSNVYTPVRLQLTRVGTPYGYCVTAGDGSGCDALWTFPNRVDVYGRPCPYAPDDWRCGGWDDPFGSNPAALAPLVYSLRLVNAIATAARAQGASALVPAAIAAGAQNISGGAAVPTQNPPDPPGFTRATTVTVPGMAGRTGSIGLIIAGTPFVTIAAPASLPPNTPATLLATWAAGAPVARVDFVMNGAVVGSAVIPAGLTPLQILAGATGAPTQASFTTAALPPGTYVVTARATSSAGIVGPDAPASSLTVQSVVPLPPPAPDCTLPSTPFTTQAQVDTWNAANPACPPITLPAPDKTDVTPPAPTKADCALPQNPNVLLGAVGYTYDPYFATSVDRDAWIAANPTCQAPPPWQATVLPLVTHIDSTVPGTTVQAVPTGIVPVPTAAPGAPSIWSALVVGAVVVAGLVGLAYVSRPQPPARAAASNRRSTRRSVAA